MLDGGVVVLDGGVVVLDGGVVVLYGGVVVLDGGVVVLDGGVVVLDGGVVVLDGGVVVLDGGVGGAPTRSHRRVDLRSPRDPETIVVNRGQARVDGTPVCPLVAVESRSARGVRPRGRRWRAPGSAGRVR